MTQQNSQQPDICGAICALATFTLIPNPPVSDTETVVLLSNSLEIERKCHRVYLVYFSVCNHGIRFVFISGGSIS